MSRTVEQPPNYAANDKGFFAHEGIQGDVVLIGSTDTLIQALIAGQVNVRGASRKIIGGTTRRLRQVYFDYFFGTKISFSFITIPESS